MSATESSPVPKTIPFRTAYPPASIKPPAAAGPSLAVHSTQVIARDGSAFYLHVSVSVGQPSYEGSGQRETKSQGVQISQPALRARPATFRSALTTTIWSGRADRRARRTIQSSADSTKTQ